VAVKKLLQLKNRSVDKGLIVIASHVEQLNSLISMPDGALGAEINETWPGPVTWILPALSTTPDWLTGGRPGLAVRIPGHPIARKLCESTGPLVSTSANPAGAEPARDLLKVRTYFGSELNYILPGSVDKTASPSQIRDAMSGSILRD
jgi:L-threonylcarbamoyladenylate synthase